MNRKVAIYARVSTEYEAQLSALDNQVFDAITNATKNYGTLLSFYEIEVRNVWMVTI